MTGLPPSSIDSFTATLEPPATLLAGAGAGALRWACCPPTPSISPPPTSILLLLLTDIVEKLIISLLFNLLSINLSLICIILDYIY